MSNKKPSNPGNSGNNPGNSGNNPNRPPGLAKKYKEYEIRVYVSSNSYSDESNLLTTINVKGRDIIAEGNRMISSARNSLEEQVRNIGLFGITVEDPKDTFAFYPPHRILKVEYNEMD